MKALLAGDPVAFGRVNGDITVRKIEAKEWDGSWKFFPTESRATRAVPSKTIEKVLILPAQYAVADDRNIGGRPSEIEEDFNLWEAQAVIGTRHQLKSIAEAFRDFTDFLTDQDGARTREWDLDTFTKHIKKNRPAIHAALVAKPPR